MNIDKLINLVSPSLLRYVVAGIVSLAVDYLTFLALYYVLHTGTAIAAPAGLTVGFVINFILNKLWSFGNRQAEPRDILRQVTYYISLVAINSIFTYYLVEILRAQGILEPKHSKLLATAVITLWNYAIYKKIIFKLEN